MTNLTIRTVEDLQGLRRKPGQFENVAIELSGLDQERARVLERRWSRWASACGCSAGGGAVLGALILSVPAALTAVSAGRLSWSTAAICVIAFAAMTSLAAKFVAIGIAHWRLRLDIDRLARSMGQPF